MLLVCMLVTFYLTFSISDWKVVYYFIHKLFIYSFMPLHTCLISVILFFSMLGTINSIFEEKLIESEFFMNKTHCQTFTSLCEIRYVNWLLMKAFLLRHMFVLVCYCRSKVIKLQAGLDEVLKWNADFNTRLSGLRICSCLWESHCQRISFLIYYG